MKAQLVALAALAALHAGAEAVAADPGASKAKPGPVKLEPIAGSSVKRITLTARAAERLGIETGRVSEEPVLRRQMVSGLVMGTLDKAPEPSKLVSGAAAFAAFGGFAQVAVTQAPPPAAEPAIKMPGPGNTWVSVSLSPGEWERLAKDKPARLLPLATRDRLPAEVLAQPSGMPPVEDVKRSMLTVYYTVPSGSAGLEMSKRMRVELQLAGGEDRQKVIPYGALYYDASGATWVYVVKQPLVYERTGVRVDRVTGEQVVLSAGPAAGTEIVTVGASLLYGTEIFGK